MCLSDATLNPLVWAESGGGCRRHKKKRIADVGASRRSRREIEELRVSPPEAVICHNREGQQFRAELSLLLIILSADSARVPERPEGRIRRCHHRPRRRPQRPRRRAERSVGLSDRIASLCSLLRIALLRLRGDISLRPIYLDVDDAVPNSDLPRSCF
ncbi:hypothetical protein BC628DRAFT_235984 [Trametes gibbosa]|nr:hypothetical protein BC628DRAFT_235984 [Trametes gibbosa]